MKFILSWPGVCVVLLARVQSSLFYFYNQSQNSFTKEKKKKMSKTGGKGEQMKPFPLNRMESMCLTLCWNEI